MVKLHSLQRRAVAEAVYEAIARDAEDWRRPHLGASLIGEACQRKLWYAFRWAASPGFDGRMLRLFRRGQIEEQGVADDLRAAGMTVVTEDDDGGQWRFVEFGGHFAGSIDGAILGVPGAPKTWHLLEVKTSNDKRFKDLQRNGVATSNPKHYAQMQVYMRKRKLTRALYVAVCKNDDHIYTERVKLDVKFADAQSRKAELIIFAAEPRLRINENPTWFECQLCEHRPHCHLRQPDKIERNCRTCISSTPQNDGTWTCDHHETTLDIDAQKAGCGDHRIIPPMIQWRVVAVDPQARELVYEDEDGTRYTDTGATLDVVP